MKYIPIAFRHTSLSRSKWPEIIVTVTARNFMFFFVFADSLYCLILV